MEIKDLNKKQMILLVLLVCFVVSIATGIVTVSLMQQVPKSVPQTINNVIERTITNVTSTPAKENSSLVGDSNVIVQIYMPSVLDGLTKDELPLGTGVIISDVGLVLVENSTLVNPAEATLFRIMLDKSLYNAEILQKFSNGFTILKILPKGKDTTNTEVPVKDTEQKPSVDIIQ